MTFIPIPVPVVVEGLRDTGSAAVDAYVAFIDWIRAATGSA